MKTLLLRCAAILAAAVFSASPASSQQAVLDRVDSFMEWVGEGLESVGKESERFLGPGIEAMEPPPPGAAESVTREFSDSFPAGPGTTVSVANRFGQIYVQSWNNPVVRVEADIHVTAATLSAASEFAEAVTIEVEGPEDERLSIRTALPDFGGAPPYEIAADYMITVPARAHVECENHWADTIVQDIRGEVTVRSWSGVVDLQRIAGPVRVEAVGEFPLQVRHVEQGGTFIMVDARAEFAHVGGESRIENNMGDVTLRDLPSDAEVNVKSNGGPVTIQLRDGSNPDLFINVLDGEVISDLPLQRHRQGKLTEASRTVAGASQRVSVSAWLGDVRVQREGVQRAERQSDPVNAVPVEDVVERSLSLEPGSRVRVQAMAGDVRVEGADSDKLTVRALRRMWLPSRAGAAEALDSLRVRLERTDDGLLLQTVPTERTEAMGASYYRADLVLSCPRDAALRVDAAEGISDISGLGGPVAVNQQEGRVTASHVKGALSLYAVQGDIAVSDCGGPLEARTGAGRISTDNVLGAQSLEAVGGGIIIKKPGAGVSAECAGGDISLTALGGVAGDYEAHASDGNVRLLLPRTADARMDLTVKNGDIQLPRGVMLAGSVEGGDWRLHGRLAGEGRYRINAGVERGDLELVTFEPDEAEAP